MQGLSFTEKFTELLSELEDCSEEEQKQKIIEINEMIERMDANELELIAFDLHAMSSESCIEQGRKRGNTKRSGNGFACIE
ncbi:uncharacterized protein MONOS_6172 [Monocercomonoides exilis]|uniref:uncharacterized protein n=1 Tax=Monocercomonoides exilis TaxID=2049356 RepID=UPI003559AD2F|nr:hypothetical protein MONOS_6172 [Monocercomonoides exilis]|eukprot:MONOS_6172.1-p1 / transcript=MONOS_6172.1 / gene=MONOS_6172 / organism=Monocercomonoides_exilis_PA203 / gene_product=unspecified product / transcript_product=unspecified product / location=Mono_scaffold00191:16604-17176(-) / protein_length=81 / sequence_SO=supercontig / SO=protein_coding / is_pseudo=false